MRLRLRSVPAAKTSVAMVAAGLLAGTLVGTLRGLWLAAGYGLFWPRYGLAALKAVSSHLDGALLVAVPAALLLAFLWMLARAAVLALPLRAEDRGSASAALVVFVLVTGAAGYHFNRQADWFPDFWSQAGLAANVVLTGMGLLIAAVVWRGLTRAWPRLEPALEAARERLTGRVAALCVAYWVAVTFGFTAAQATGSEPSPEPPAHVVLIGLDGAAWNLMDPLLAEGRMPQLQALLEKGARGPLQTLVPTLSPIVWTTVATGRPMREHGISGFLVDKTAAEQRVITSDKRRTKALWNVLSEHGRSVGVVGWWVTWPAEAVRGFMVSSYATLGRTWKGRIRRGIDRQTYPPGLLAEVEPIMDEVEGELDETFERLFPQEVRARLNDDQRIAVADTKEVLLADMLNARIGAFLLRTRRPDFFALYLGGIDVVGHRFWKYAFPRSLPYRITAAEAEMLGRVIPDYYTLTDALLAPVLAACDQRTLVIVVSDHGMGPYRPPDGNDDVFSGHHLNAPPGVVIISGAGARAGARLRRASVLDIAPTVLHVMGMPLAADMAGFPLVQGLDGRPAGARYVRTYEDGSRAAKSPQAHDAGELDELLRSRLKSLGYL